MVKLFFSKKLRLLTSESFKFIFQKPKRYETVYISILGRPNKIEYPRIGIIVAKKHIKKSHERNRIKRIIRESFRLNQHFLPYEDFIVIIKKNIIFLDNSFLVQQLKKLWLLHYLYYKKLY